MAEENIPNKNEPESVISDYLEGYQQLELQASENNLNKARNAIFVIAALFLAGSLIQMAVSDTFSTFGLVIAFGGAAIFLVLGFMTKKQPLGSIVVALLLFVGLWVLDIVVVGPEYIYKGIVVKAIIVYFLVTGIKHARETERLRKEMKQFQNKPQ